MNQSRRRCCGVSRGVTPFTALIYVMKFIKKHYKINTLARGSLSLTSGLHETAHPGLEEGSSWTKLNQYPG